MQRLTGRYFVDHNSINQVLIQETGLEGIYNVESPKECGAWHGLGCLDGYTYRGIYIQHGREDHLEDVVGIHIGYFNGKDDLVIMGQNQGEYSTPFVVTWTRVEDKGSSRD